MEFDHLGSERTPAAKFRRGSQPTDDCDLSKNK
jgi:hypothetical protein